VIVISDFTELDGDPRYGGINAADFGASKFCFSVGTLAKLAAVWSDEYEGEEPVFKLYGFDRKLKFSSQARYSLSFIICASDFSIILLLPLEPEVCR